VTALVSDYLVVEVVDVASDVVSEWSSSSRFEFKNDRIALLIVSSTIDLRSEEHFARFHVSEVVFFPEFVKFFSGEGNPGLVRGQVKHVVVVEVLCVRCEHLLHVFAHLEEDRVGRFSKASI
jgi:hypothetical protein